MATSITTFSGLRCTIKPRTQFFTTISTSAATETAGLPVIFSSVATSATQESSVTSSTSSTSQPTESSTISSLTSLTTTVISASSTITAAASILPAAASSSADPLSPQPSDNGSAVSTGNGSKKDVIAAAIGASLGAVAVVALVILCAYIRRRKRRTPSAINDEEKEHKRPRRLSGLAPLINRLRQGFPATFVSSLATKTRAAIAGRRTSRSTIPNAQSEPSVRIGSESMGNRMSTARQVSSENTYGQRNISPQSQTVPYSANPFADPPENVNRAIIESDSQPQNPFADTAEPSIQADSDRESTFPMKLRVRNGGSDDDDNINDHPDIDRRSNQSGLSGSTLNIPSARASSPIIHEFNFRLDSWYFDRKPEDRTSTHSDPFDLERPPTIHSSAHPTPMVEQQKSQREGYFPALYYTGQPTS